jgi:hypothetical protein
LSVIESLAIVVDRLSAGGATLNLDSSSSTQSPVSTCRNKRKKKVAIDCNEVFASNTIEAAQEEQVRLQTAWNQRGDARRTATVMIGNHIAQFQHEF